MTDTNIATTPSDNGTAPSVPARIVNVTPELAAEWLSRNNHNRNLRERVAISYATDMTNGDWRWTGETIKFADDGTLIDGQHRLRAIVISEVTVPMLVVDGLDASAQEDVDRGIPRKFADVLQLRGETSSASLAALTRRVHAWERGFRRNIDSSTASATVAQMLRTLDEHPELREVVTEANRIASHSDLTGSVVGLAMWVFDGIDSEDSRHFFDRLIDGTGHSKGEPIYELRRTLAGTRDVRGERSQTYLLAITIKAWNAYREGRTVGLYRWRPGGARPEEFPEPV